MGATLRYCWIRDFIESLISFCEYETVCPPPIAFVTSDTAALDATSLAVALTTAVPYDTAALTIRRLDSFPMTPTGKIAKAELRQMAIAGAA